MKRLHVKFIKWLSNKFGYKIAMLKASNGKTTIEGDKDLLRYVDISGYFFKKEPLSRIQLSKAPTSAKEMFLSDPKPDVSNIPPITKLTPEQLKAIKECIEDTKESGSINLKIVKDKMNTNKQDWDKHLTPTVGVSDEMQRALDWWHDLPIQNLIDMNDSWVGYLWKYYPDKEHPYHLTGEEVQYIYESERYENSFLNEV